MSGWFKDRKISLVVFSMRAACALGKNVELHCSFV